ncbi:MAG TPA: DUF5719 family protein [Chloroflexota bacterium]|nr:DUF5719 family protein [Chloroflexota bacterium]
MVRRHRKLGGHVLALAFLFLWLLPAGVSRAGAAAPARVLTRNAPSASIHIQTPALIETTPVTATVTAATVVVTPTEVAAGATVTIHGSGYVAGETVTIQLATTGTVTTTETLAEVKADANGIFTKADLLIPGAVPAGDYRIVATGVSKRVGDAALKLTTVAATLTVNSASFSPGDAVRVSGAHFGPGEQVFFSLSSASQSASVPLGHAQANHAGNVGPVTLRIPFGVQAGKLLLVASGQTTNRTATVSVSVSAAAATLAVTPTSVKPGERVAISGTHLQPGETVVVDLVALSTSAQLGTARVNAAGNFALSAVIPANTPQGTVSVVATGMTSHLSATKPIAVGALPATLQITGSPIKAGATVSVAGTGFIPGEGVTFLLHGGKLNSLTLGSVVADTAGKVAAAHLVIPSLVPAGSYSVIAYGQTSGRSATATLAVQAPPPSAPILSVLGGAPGPGGSYLLSPGGLVDIGGSNFPAHAKVTIALVSSGRVTALALLTTSSSGTLGPAGVTLPANTAAGAYSLEARVGQNKIAGLAVHVAALAPRLSLSTNAFSPGAKVGVRGFGFAPGEQIVLALNSSALATVPTAILADSHGSFSAAFTVPDTVLNGTNQVIASGASSRASVQAAAYAHLPVASRWYFPNGDTTGNHQTSIAMLNPSDAPATVHMTFLYQVGPEQKYTQIVPAHREVSVGLGLVAGTGRQVSTILESDRQISAASTITYGAADSSTALGASGPATTWYLAEGYTNASFSEYLHIMNPNNAYATIDVRFLPFNNRPAREVRFTMQPESNIQINAGQYMPGLSISAIVTADHPVVVERSMHFGRGGRGAHDKIGVTSASTIWQFAHGESAPNRQTFFTILNPNQAAPAAVTATFYDHTGRPVGSTTVIVDPLHRGNIKLNDVLPVAQVATVLTSNVPVVVERPSYSGPADLSQAMDGSVVFGQNGGGLSWAFPGGTTEPGNVSQIFLFNPGLKTVSVRATFYSDLGVMTTQDYSLAPNSDTVIGINSVPGLPQGRYGVVLKSTNGGVFLAEQSNVNAGLQQMGSTQGIAQ